MSDAFKCDRCGKDSEGRPYKLSGYGPPDSGLLILSVHLCESCAHDAERWVNEPPPEAAS